MNIIRKIPLAFLSVLLISSWVTLANVYAQGIGSPLFPGPGAAPASGGACASNGPLDVVTETPKIAVGLRALKKTYSGPVLLMSVTGTSGTYFNVGLSGCNLDTSMLSSCTTLSAPTSSTGCPVEEIYDQSGNGCNVVQFTTSLQGWLLVSDAAANNRPTIVMPSSPTYSCTLSTPVTSQTNASEIDFISESAFLYGIVMQNASTGDNAMRLAWGTTATLSQTYDGATFSTSSGTTASFSQNNYITQVPATGGVNLTVDGVDGTPGTSITVESTTIFAIGGLAPAAMHFAETESFNVISGCSGTTGECQALYNNMSAYWQ